MLLNAFSSYPLCAEDMIFVDTNVVRPVLQIADVDITKQFQNSRNIFIKVKLFSQ